MKYHSTIDLCEVYRVRSHQAILLLITRWLLWVCCSGITAAHAQEPAAEIETILAAIVGVESQVPDNARTAKTLGTERSGSGVVIDSSGLIATIGYLILEAASTQVELNDGTMVPAKVIAYDHDTGFGLLRALQPIAVKPMRLGRSVDLKETDKVLVVSHGGANAVRPATVVSRRTFAGYWEYLLDDAIFTSPPHPVFGGAALIGPEGDLLGIGSLVVGDARPGEDPLPGNMFVPIDRLEPILGDLLTTGRSLRPARPWLGIYAEEYRGYLFVTRVAENSPAAESGIKTNEIITQVAGQSVDSLADFYRKVWALGDAGVDVPITVLRLNQLVDISVASSDRYQWLRLNPSF
jgi:S1-C subfamily serine protease